MPRSATVTPILKGKTKKLATAERSELIQYYSDYKTVKREWLKRQILENNRIDLLATEILGYIIKPFHFSMLRFQFLHPQSLQLAYRGAGKSVVCTITKTIHYLLKNPNLRIMIASKSLSNSQGFLKEIKAHFESNTNLIETFGEYYDPRLVNKWDNTEIEVLPRTKHGKEASVTCVSVGGTIVSKHYDVLMPDDLIDEDNARTQLMRDKTQTWYYKTLEPTLEPPDSEVEHRGENHRLGTRYHFADLYGHWIENELKDHHRVVKALDDKNRSPWPEKHTPEWFLNKRKTSGVIIFNSQYLCSTEAMKGEIFQYDDCQIIKSDKIPDDIKIFMGVDLAISEDEKADHFAIVVLGKDSNGNRYFLDWYEGQLRFSEQTQKIIEFYNKYDPIKCCIETNAYQKAQYQTLKDEDKDIRLKAVNQDKDKITRAWKLSAFFEDKKMFFKRVGGIELVIEQIVLFPSYRYKDLFDAFDLAVRASKLKKRKKRKSEPGLI